MNTNTLIELRDLKTYFYTEDGVVKAVDGVSFSIERQKTLGVVGESGCGKSVTALSIMGLVPQPPGKIVGARSSTGATASRSSSPSSTPRERSIAPSGATRSP
jgi:ABC-type dipeptide/oligopeptide/nickel transport system ATPase component